MHGFRVENIGLLAGKGCVFPADMFPYLKNVKNFHKKVRSQPGMDDFRAGAAGGSCRVFQPDGLRGASAEGKKS